MTDGLSHQRPPDRGPNETAFPLDASITHTKQGILGREIHERRRATRDGRGKYSTFVVEVAADPSSAVDDASHQYGKRLRSASFA
ncbi:MAG: hypothetical protein U5K74_02085 [Gemmatimonadaceae bacterium]|nr:hypothetical protein [Gemmatimonadaceae bacterium]